jgi:hypothetical protein
VNDDGRSKSNPHRTLLHHQESGLPHLSLAAVFDALSYYCDHKEEIDDYIIRNRVPDELIHPSVKHL